MRPFYWHRSGSKLRKKAFQKPLTRRPLRTEWLEDRSLLSAASVVISPSVEPLTSSSASAGLTASAVEAAYSLTGVTGSSGTAAGSGQTIAIIDAYNDPSLRSDLATFDSKMGLSAANLTVVNQSGGTSLPASNAGWDLEISLDVEWAHAVAPGANILLVEASSSNLNDLLAGVNYARDVSSVSVISMSWGSSEFMGETQYDSDFTTPAGHIGISFVASSGDDGSPGLWPAMSTNVLAVGGTTLSTTTTGSYVGETAWSDSGGGTSVYEAEPTYQTSVQSTGARTTPDVSYDANPSTGYAVYDSVSYDGTSGWSEVGGTSAGAPQWSAIIAIADQGRVAAGESTLNGAQGALYSLPSSDFHDVTSGSNGGYQATAGYDEVTGRGTPIGSVIVAGLEAYTQSTSTGSGSSGSGSSGSGSSGSGSTGSGNNHNPPSHSPPGHGPNSYFYSYYFGGFGFSGFPGSTGFLADEAPTSASSSTSALSMQSALPSAPSAANPLATGAALVQAAGGATGQPGMLLDAGPATASAQGATSLSSQAQPLATLANDVIAGSLTSDSAGVVVKLAGNMPGGKAAHMIETNLADSLPGSAARLNSTSLDAAAAPASTAPGQYGETNLLEVVDAVHEATWWNQVSASAAMLEAVWSDQSSELAAPEATAGGTSSNLLGDHDDLSAAAAAIVLGGVAMGSVRREDRPQEQRQQPAPPNSLGRFDRRK